MPTRLLIVAALLLLSSACSDPVERPAPVDPMPDAGEDVVVEDEEVGPPACTYDIDCSGVAGTICLDGHCVEGRCRPGERSCVGEDIVLCNEDAETTVVVESCVGATVCINAQCAPRTCEPDTVKCQGRSRVRCNSRGTGFDTLPCFGEQVCFEGRCDDPVCNPGKTLCLDDLTLGVCHEDGGGYVDQLCGFGRRCTNGQCAPFHALSFEVPEAKASSPSRRPDSGYVALWIVLDRMPEATVEVMAWASPVGGVYVRWDPGAAELLLGTDRALGDERRFAMPLQLGDVVQLVVAWEGPRLSPWLDGYLLPGDVSEVVPVGGTPSDTLTLGRFSAHGVAWPGRIGSVWVGTDALTEGFVPRCDEAPSTAVHAVWKLDEGEGDQAWATDGEGAPFSLDGPVWTGGILGRYARDADNDGYAYDPEARISCGPINIDDRLRLGDCNDANAIVYPGAPEPVDRIDNDCDGEIDETD